MKVPAHIQSLIAAANTLRAEAGQNDQPFCLAWFSDERQPDLAAQIAALPPVEPGVLAVIFRHYQHPAREVMAREIQELCRGRNILFFEAVSNTPFPGLDPDGYHLPEKAGLGFRDLACEFDGLPVSMACHSGEALAHAVSAGAALAFISPVFETGSHPGAPVLGADGFREIVGHAPLPVLALGGVNQDTLPRLSGSGAAGFGAIDAFSKTWSASTKSE